MPTAYSKEKYRFVKVQYSTMLFFNQPPTLPRIFGGKRKETTK